MQNLSLSGKKVGLFGKKCLTFERLLGLYWITLGIGYGANAL